MSYLGQFWRFLQAIFLQLDRLPGSVSGAERMSRFIFHKKHMSETKGRVSSAAFMPSATTKNISVYRTSSCNERRIWLIGDLFVARKLKPPRDVLARGDVQADIILNEGLAIVASPLPHPRHADVTNWPDDKPLQKIKAMALAEGAPLRLHPRRIGSKAKA